jgi:Tfp pilus assembly protein PilF
VRNFVEIGTPSSLQQALKIIQERGLESSEFGRVMNAVAVTVLHKIYGQPSNRLPSADPPQTHHYTRILRDAERRYYSPVPVGSSDYLDYVLPFLALLEENQADILLTALPDQRHAWELRDNSVLAPYFTGVILERSGSVSGNDAMQEEAGAAYSRAYEISDECYPAALGLARVLKAQGRSEEAVSFLANLSARYPDNQAITRQLAIARFDSRDWAGAEVLLAELLQRDNRDGQLLLMRARSLIEQGLFFPAQSPLDTYATIDPQNREYLFLQARIQAEGYRNLDNALSFLRTILYRDAQDREALIYASRLLLESNQAEDQDEGREFLSRLLEAEDIPLEVIDIALKDAIRRQAWKEAHPYLEQVLAVRRGAEELLAAYTVERGLGNLRAGLAAARELHEREPAHVEGATAYITALIEGGSRDEAARLIENGLQTLPSGVLKSRYLYLRSLLYPGGEQAVADLRSSLFEDPRNVHTLIALFEYYRTQKNEQRAVFYLKQALALEPGNLQLKRYEAELRYER